MLPSDINLTDDMCKVISEEFFKKQHKPLLNIYVEMESMFDYKLSALLKMIKTEKEFEYIKTKLPLYRTYKGKNITRCFPALKFTENDIDNFIKDPNNHLYLSAGSLITNVSNLVPGQIAFFNMINKNSPMYNHEPITIYFNNSLFPVAKESCRHIFNSLSSIFPNIDCKFSNRSLKQESKDFIEHIDHFILDDLKSFTEKDTLTYKMLFIERKFILKMISASYLFDEEYAFMSEQSKEQIKNTELVFSPFCMFMLFDKQLIEFNEEEK